MPRSLRGGSGLEVLHGCGLSEVCWVSPHEVCTPTLGNGVIPRKQLSRGLSALRLSPRTFGFRSVPEVGVSVFWLEHHFSPQSFGLRPSLCHCLPVRGAGRSLSRPALHVLFLWGLTCVVLPLSLHNPQEALSRAPVMQGCTECTRPLPSHPDQVQFQSIESRSKEGRVNRDPIIIFIKGRAEGLE